MHGNKIVARPLSWEDRYKALKGLLKAPIHLAVVGVFLSPHGGCVMTRAQGDKISLKIEYLENEVAKLQRVRHDMEVLLSQVRNTVDRIAMIEEQLNTLKASLLEDSSRNVELVAELQKLRGELEDAQNRYRNLEQDQQSLAKHQMALKEAQNKIRVPPLKSEHFALAKKYYTAQKLDEAVFLFEQFVKDYSDDADLTAQSYFYLGDIYLKQADAQADDAEKEKFYKKSVVSHQNVVDATTNDNHKEEALFKMGQAFKALGNTEGALAAFKKFLAEHKKSKRVALVKQLMAEIEKKKE